MKKMTLEEIKKCEFDILCLIDNICRKENIRYTLIGGTLLGAVRHKGFIPWDDDIDISMPRADYMRFMEYCESHDLPIRFVSHETDKRYKDIFAKVYDKRTRIDEQIVNRYGFDCGVYIDVYPVDGLGNSFDEAMKCFNSSKLNRELLNAANWKRYSKSKTRPIYIEAIRFPLFVISRFVNPDTLIEKIEKTYIKKSFDESKFVAGVAGTYREKEIMPVEVYSSFMELEFEGRKFCAICNYDIWLKKIYGNYMKIPPTEKQVTHHSFNAFYI